MVLPLPSKQKTRVRFPQLAPTLLIYSKKMFKFNLKSWLFTELAVILGAERIDVHNQK